MSFLVSLEKDFFNLQKKLYIFLLTLEKKTPTAAILAIIPCKIMLPMPGSMYANAFEVNTI